MNIRALIPQPAKQVLKKLIVDPVRSKIRNHHLKICIRRLRAGERSTELLIELLKAWGNEGFSADLRYVQEATRLAEKCKGPILECGTGLTTLICGVIAEKRGIELWCLEQDLEWLDEVKRILDANNIKPKLFFTPLQIFGNYAWHDISRIGLPKHFGLVICDGPFISNEWPEEIFKGWRFGVMPALSFRSITFSTLLLDDANEKRAPEVLAQWDNKFGVQHKIIESELGDCAIVTPRNPQSMPIYATD